MFRTVFALLVLAASGAAVAQLDVPRVDIPPLALPVDLPGTDALAPNGLAATLQRVRIERLEKFVLNNRKLIDWDINRQPAVRDVLIGSALDDAAIATAEGAGFPVIERDVIEGLDLAFVKFGLPKGKNLKAAQMELRQLLPDADIDANNIYFQSGAADSKPEQTTNLASAKLKNVSLGLIDGGVANHASVAGRVEQSGFAKGAPAASSHGTSVAALIIGNGTVKGSAAGGTLLAADVYGNDKAGGSASAIARALGWLTGRGVSVVTVSLVGPDNALLRKAIAAAQQKGVIIVAAVGNDGPAAPASYPASYLGVLAVTGVDAKNKALPEAGKAAYLSFAAPGAGFSSATNADRVGKVRGTSYAAPLVAGRLSLFYSRQDTAAVEPSVRKLMADALDLGKKGYDAVYGHGLICGNCVTRS